MTNSFDANTLTIKNVPFDLVEKYASKFVKEHIVGNKTDLVDFIRNYSDDSDAPFTDENIKNNFPRAEFVVDIKCRGLQDFNGSHTIYEGDNELQLDLEDLLERAGNNLDAEDEILSVLDELADLEYEEPEVYSWIELSDYGYRLLDQLGEIILETDEASYWGRACCGQAYSSDSCIEQAAIQCYRFEIVEELEAKA